jgi:hypothetical protein
MGEFNNLESINSKISIEYIVIHTMNKIGINGWGDKVLLDEVKLAIENEPEHYFVGEFPNEWLVCLHGTFYRIYWCENIAGDREFRFVTFMDEKHINVINEFKENIYRKIKGNENVDYKYIIHYIYGEIANSTGCYTFNQAKEISEAIALWVKTTTRENAEISIQDVETGNVEPFYY